MYGANEEKYRLFFPASIGQIFSNFTGFMLAMANQLTRNSHRLGSVLSFGELFYHLIAERV